MAYAMLKGVRFNVRVTQDLADNFGIEVFPEVDPETVKTAEPYKNWPVPLLLKLKADTREDALLHGLEHLKKLARIDDYHLDPHERPKPPEPPPAKATPAEAPKPPAPDAQG